MRDPPVNDPGDPHGTEPEDAVSSVVPAPSHVGRYRVERLLGEGGFGRVYLARDEQLLRRVAVKVPRPDRFARLGDAEGYVAEARVLAQLDHPHIVPVHDIGQTSDGLPFVVSKFIEGSDLGRRIKQSRPSFAASALRVRLDAVGRRSPFPPQLVNKSRNGGRDYPAQQEQNPGRLTHRHQPEHDAAEVREQQHDE
jgi:hypothetical protein